MPKKMDGGQNSSDEQNAEEETSTFRSGFGRHYLEEFMQLDLRELRSASINPMRTLERLKQNATLLSKSCSHFKSVDHIGICSIHQVVCPSWTCEYLEGCMPICSDSCLLKIKSTRRYDRPPKEMTKALSEAEARLTTLVNAIEPSDVYGFLVHRCEELIPLAFTKTPLEFQFIMFLRGYLYNQYGDLTQYRIPRSPPDNTRLSELWDLMMTIFVLKRDIEPMKNGDVSLFLAQTGQKMLRKLRKNPLHTVRFMKRRLAFFDSASIEEIPKPGYISKSVWTLRMAPVLRWCFQNEFDPRPAGRTLEIEYRNVLAHMDEVEKTGEIKLSDCLMLGLPFYSTAYHALRFYILNEGTTWFKAAIEHYSCNNTMIDYFDKKGINFWPWLWDNTVTSIPLPDNDPFKRRFPNLLNATEAESLANIAQSPIWPISDGHHVLLWSSFLLTFALRNAEELVTDPREAGKWFETTVAEELKSRSLPIIPMDDVLPEKLGDIDVMTMHSGVYYALEAKDWGPRSRNGYFSSKEYSQRLKDYMKEVKKHQRRIGWARNNLSKLELPSNASIRGLLVTAFSEPHLKGARDVKIVSHMSLCAIFGGTPVNPVLTLSDVAVGIVPKTAASISKNGELSIEEMEPTKPTRLDTIMSLVSERILKRYGSTDAYHLYRAALEISLAIDLKGVGVKEGIAEPSERPGKLTFDYLLFVYFRSDEQSRERFADALKQLTENKLLLERNGVIEITNYLEPDYLQMIDGELITATNKDKAHVILHERLMHNTNLVPMIGISPPLIRTSLTEDWNIVDFR